MSFKSIPNKKPTEVKGVNFSSDSGDISFIPPEPLHYGRNMCIYICGGVGSGKTSLLMSLLHAKGHKKKNSNEKHARFFWKVFNKVYMMSASLGTMDLDKIKVPEDQIFGDYDPEILQTIIDDEKDSEENNNTLIVIDDCIKSINNSRNKLAETTLCRAIINRRHCCVHNDGPKGGGLSLILTSQKYNFLLYSVRANISHLCVFRTNNNKEKQNIFEEYCNDLSDKGFHKLLDYVWDKPYQFLFIDINQPTSKKYYKNFDLIIIPDEFLS